MQDQQTPVAQQTQADQQISAPQVVQLAAASAVCTKTVERVYKGGGSAYSRERVTRAARKLRMPLPVFAASTATPARQAAAIAAIATSTG